jgi:hypothetical protein
MSLAKGLKINRTCEVAKEKCQHKKSDKASEQKDRKTDLEIIIRSKRREAEKQEMSWWNSMSNSRDSAKHTRACRR